MNKQISQEEMASKELGAKIAVLLFALFPEESERQKTLAEIEQLPAEQLPLVLDWLEARQAAIGSGVGAALDADFSNEVLKLKEDYKNKQAALSAKTLSELEALEKELED